MRQPLVLVGACIALGLSAHCAPVHDATPTTCPAGQEPSGALCVCISTQAPPIDGSCDTKPPGDGGTACSIDDCEDDGNPCTEPTCPEGGGTCENEPAIDQSDCEIEEGAGSCVQGVCIVDSPAWELGRPFQIGGGMDEIVWPKVELAADGTGIATWAEGNRLMASHFSPDEGWTEPLVVQEEIFPKRGFHLGVDGEGNAVIVFARVETTAVDIRSVRFDSGTGLWSASEVISRSSAIATHPFIRVTPDGDAWATWSEAPGEIVLRHTRTTALAWDPPVVVPFVDATPKRAPRLDLTDSGAGALVFVGYDSADEAESVWVAALGQDGSLGTPARVDSDVGEVVYARVAMSDNGQLMATWEQANDIWYAHASDGNWEPAALLEASSGSAFSSVIGADALGNFIAAWCQARDMRVRRFLGAEQRWDDLEILRVGDSETARRPSLKLTPNGNASLAWLEGGSIRLGEFSPESGWDTYENVSDALGSAEPPPEHGPWLSTAADGTIAVVWGDGRSVWAWADRR